MTNPESYSEESPSPDGELRVVRGCLRTAMEHNRSVIIGELTSTYADLAGIACRSCATTFEVSEEDQGATNSELKLPDCPTSGHCEIEWVSLHAERYLRPDKSPIAPRVNCANCSVVINLKSSNGELQPTTSEDSFCSVTRAGKEFWRTGGLRQLEATSPLYAGLELEKFDGEGSQEDDEEADVAETPSFDDTCVGSYLETQQERTGYAPQPAVYECPRSVQSGEHCNLQLRVGEDGQVTGEQDGASWLGSCLVNRTMQTGRQV
jgi:hypothetical protein